MNRLHKSLIGSLALAAAALTVWTAAAKLAPTSGPQGAPASGPLPTGALQSDTLQNDTLQNAASQTGTLQTAAREPVTAPATAAARPAIPAPVAVEMPAGLRATVKKSPLGPLVTLEHRGHVLAVRAGKVRKIGNDRVEWLARTGEALSLTWETTATTTLETVRGQLAWSGDGESADLSDAVLPPEAATRKGPFHACRGVHDGEGGFTVACKVDTPAAAAAVESVEASEGVWSMLGYDRTFVRFDLPMTGDGAVSKVIGFEKGGRGTLVRVEASRAPGEDQALLAIGDADRSQPRPRRFVCRFPNICEF